MWIMWKLFPRFHVDVWKFKRVGLVFVLNCFRKSVCICYKGECCCFTEVVLSSIFIFLITFSYMKSCLAIFFITGMFFKIIWLERLLNDLTKLVNMLYKFLNLIQVCYVRVHLYLPCIYPYKDLISHHIIPFTRQIQAFITKKKGKQTKQPNI